MKHHKVLANRILFTAIAALFLWLPSSAYAEEVRLFESDIAIQEDGSLLVTETIHYDFGALKRHGIFRDIGHQHPQASTVWYKQRHIDISVESVSRDGIPEQNVVKRGSDTTHIKIGDPDRTIIGEHEYKIHYRVEGGLSYLDDGTAELYWNATGHDWPVVIEKTVVTVHGHNDVLRARRACYEGEYGSVQRCDVYSDVGTASVFTTSRLVPGQELTIAQEIDPAKVSVNIVESVPWWVFAAFGFIFAVLFLVYALYRYETKYRPGNRTIIPQYEPYPEVLPMFSGVLIDGRLQARDITAGILYLAQEGFISIKHTTNKVAWLFDVDDYEVTALQDVDLLDDSSLPSIFHRTLLSLFFTVISKGVTVKLSELQKSGSKKRKNYAALRTLRSSIIKDLEKRGFFENYRVSKSVLTFVGFALTIFWTVASHTFPLLLLGLIPLILIYLIVKSRRTRLGYEAMYHLRGFKEFLSVTDTDRFTFHNAPKKNPEQFLEYLPYAVALGVEKQWAEVFKDIIVQVPDWYDGDGTSTFSAIAFTSDLGLFSHALTQGVTSGNAPRSSGGSSGGGFSGGGGGGGGGGSW